MVDRPRVKVCSLCRQSFDGYQSGPRHCKPCRKKHPQTKDIPQSAGEIQRNMDLMMAKELMMPWERETGHIFLMDGYRCMRCACFRPAASVTECAKEMK